MLGMDEIAREEIDDGLLARVANVDGIKDQFGLAYEFVRRRAKPVGVLCHAGFIIKIYHMIRDDMPLESGTAETLETFICDEIDAGHIDRKQGIGFAILGQGFLSISVWGKGNGIYVQTYLVEGTHAIRSRKTLEHTAVACTWDSRIMFHEILAWHEYLNTSMSRDDKLVYLKSFVSGYLDEASLTPAKCVAA